MKNRNLKQLFRLCAITINVLILLCFIQQGCKKDNSQEPQPDEQDLSDTPLSQDVLDSILANSTFFAEPDTTDEITSYRRNQPSSQQIITLNPTPEVDAALHLAWSLLRTPYVRGGRNLCIKSKYYCNPPGIYGLDCSGLVYYCLTESGIKNVPDMNALGMSDTSNWKKCSHKVIEIDRNERFQKGDLMFFDFEEGINHVGIWAGYNVFVKDEKFPGIQRAVLNSVGTKVCTLLKNCKTNGQPCYIPTIDDWSKDCIHGVKVTRYSEWVSKDPLHLKKVLRIVSDVVTIDGHIYDCDGMSAPIQGAVVSTSLDTITAISNSSGYFFLQTHTATGSDPNTNYSNTPYTITITKPGYYPGDGLLSGGTHIWGAHPLNGVFCLSR